MQSVTLFAKCELRHEMAVERVRPGGRRNPTGNRVCETGRIDNAPSRFRRMAENASFGVSSRDTQRAHVSPTGARLSIAGDCRTNQYASFPRPGDLRDPVDARKTNSSLPSTTDGNTLIGIAMSAPARGRSTYRISIAAEACAIMRKRSIAVSVTANGLNA